MDAGRIRQTILSSATGILPLRMKRSVSGTGRNSTFDQRASCRTAGSADGSRSPRSPGLATEVPVGPSNGLDDTSVVNLDNVFTIDQRDLGRRVGHVLGDQKSALFRAVINASIWTMTFPGLTSAASPCRDG